MRQDSRGSCVLSSDLICADRFDIVRLMGVARVRDRVAGWMLCDSACIA